MPTLLQAVNVKKYFRYHELMDTIKDMREENRKLRSQLKKFYTKYFVNNNPKFTINKWG